MFGESCSPGCEAFWEVTGDLECAGLCEINPESPGCEYFFEAFQLGSDYRYISGVDGDGVATSAIQGLCQMVQE